MVLCSAARPQPRAAAVARRGCDPALARAARFKVDTGLGGAVGVSSLTTAELRLLPLLFTHLTFAEIANGLYVSPHAVKTQAISVYRKLGASSRGQAVQRVQQLGLGG